MHDPGALRQAVADSDLDALTLVPGVGKRTAERLIVELRARLDVPDMSAPDGSGDQVPSARREVREALTGLGYGPDEVRETLARIPEDGTVEDLLRESLRLLAVAR